LRCRIEGYRRGPPPWIASRGLAFAVALTASASRLAGVLPRSGGDDAAVGGVSDRAVLADLPGTSRRGHRRIRVDARVSGEGSAVEPTTSAITMLSSFARRGGVSGRRPGHPRDGGRLRQVERRAVREHLVLRSAEAPRRARARTARRHSAALPLATSTIDSARIGVSIGRPSTRSGRLPPTPLRRRFARRASRRSRPCSWLPRRTNGPAAALLPRHAPTRPATPRAGMPA
jgi:hypothetical protein